MRGKEVKNRERVYVCKGACFVPQPVITPSTQKSKRESDSITEKLEQEGLGENRRQKNRGIKKWELTEGEEQKARNKFHASIHVSELPSTNDGAKSVEV